MYHAEKPFPLDRAAFVLTRHGGAAVIYAGIFFNALLFTGIWLYKEWHPEEFDELDDEEAEEERRRRHDRDDVDWQHRARKRPAGAGGGGGGARQARARR